MSPPSLSTVSLVEDTSENHDLKAARDICAMVMKTYPCACVRLQWLLELRMDHLQPDKTKTTPLHLACVNGHVEAAKELLDFDGPSLTALNVS